MKDNIKSRFRRLVIKQAQRLLSEAVVIDESLKNQIKDFYDLQMEVSQLEAKLNEAKQKYGQIKDVLDPVISGMKEVNQKLLVVEDYVIEVKKHSYDRTSVSYKDAFELGLSKVNEATRKILLQAAEAQTKVSKVGASFSIKKKNELGEVAFSYNLDGDTVKKLKDKLMGVINKFTNLFTKQSENIETGTEEMRDALRGK
jgi:hypothetical protein